MRSYAHLKSFFPDSHSFQESSQPATHGYEVCNAHLLTLASFDSSLAYLAGFYLQVLFSQMQTSQLLICFYIYVQTLLLLYLNDNLAEYTLFSHTYFQDSRISSAFFQAFNVVEAKAEASHNPFHFELSRWFFVNL